jgi:hypothetical protein
MPTTKPSAKLKPPEYESLDWKVTVLSPATTARAPLTGGVFQVELELQLPLETEDDCVKAELLRVREIRRVNEKREQGLKAFA